MTPSWLSLVLCSAASLGAQVAGPRLGFAFDPALGQLRPIAGAPGAALLTEPIALPDSASTVVVRGGRAFALAQGSLWLLPHLPDSHAVELTGTIPSPDRLFVNSGGTAALLVSSQTRRLQLVSIPPAPRGSNTAPEPVLSPWLDWHRWVRGEFLTAAVLSQSPCAVLSSSSADGSTGYLERLCFGTLVESQLLAERAGLNATSLATITPLTTGPARPGADQNDLLLADPAANQIYRLRLSGPPDGRDPLESLAGAADGIDQPLALAASDAWIVVANRQSLSVVSLSGGVLRTIALPEVPLALAPLGDVLLLRPPGPESHPALLVDPTREFRPFYVPYAAVDHPRE